MRDLLDLIIAPGADTLTRAQRISRTKRAGRPKYIVRGQQLTATEIAQRAGISYQAVLERIARGWNHNDLDKPAMRKAA